MWIARVNALVRRDIQIHAYDPESDKQYEVIMVVAPAGPINAFVFADMCILANCGNLCDTGF